MSFAHHNTTCSLRSPPPATTPPTGQTSVMSEHGMTRGPHVTHLVCRCWRMPGFQQQGSTAAGQLTPADAFLGAACGSACMLLGPCRVPAVWVVSLRLALRGFCCFLLHNLLQITRPLRAPTPVPLSPTPSRLEPSARTVSWSLRAAPARCGRPQQPAKPTNSSSSAAADGRCHRQQHCCCRAGWLSWKHASSSDWTWCSPRLKQQSSSVPHPHVYCRCPALLSPLPHTGR